jgi:cyclic pyranopterin monophosphate synthase
LDKFTHIDESGRAKMVDLSNKRDTKREALAYASIYMKEKTLIMIRDGEIEKGAVLETARVAGIMGVKKTPDLIPMCHQLLITGIDIDFEFINDNTIGIWASAKTNGKTGVEMEALIGVSITALTIYDMCKAVDKGMIISDIKLLKKSGGKSGEYIRGDE